MTPCDSGSHRDEGEAADAGGAHAHGERRRGGGVVRKRTRTQAAGTPTASSVVGAGDESHGVTRRGAVERDLDQASATGRILGIDPGSRRTGYAVLLQRGRTLTVADSGTIVLGQGEIGQRLASLQQQLELVVARARPDMAAVEDIFTARNARSALSLGQARGVALATIGRAGLSIHAYAPAMVKRAVAGHGRADKRQIQHMVRVLLSLPGRPAGDEADAMAIAICHALNRRAGVGAEARTGVSAR